MEGTEEVKEKHSEEIPENAPQKEQETLDEMLSRHRWYIHVYSGPDGGVLVRTFKTFSGLLLGGLKEEGFYELALLSGAVITRQKFKRVMILTIPNYL